MPDMQDDTRQLRNSLPLVECRKGCTHGGGDHLIVLVEVLAFEAQVGDAPVFCRGNMRHRE